MPAVLPPEALPFELLPTETIAGLPVDVTFAVQPPHPSNQMHIERVSNGRLRSPLGASPVGGDGAAGAQRFLGRLPAVTAGETVEYTPVLTRSGLVIERLQARATRGLARVAPTVEPSREPLPAGAVPRYEWRSGSDRTPPPRPASTRPPRADPKSQPSRLR